MPTLLLELFSEEIPARMQRGAAEQLARLMTKGLEQAGLAHGEIKTFVSPRHLAIQIFDLPARQPDVTEEKKGPRVGAPEQAIQGFLQSSGLKLSACEQRTVGKDTYYFATVTRKGQATSVVAQTIIEATLAAFTWPKSMRWGAHKMQWVRPLHRILCLLDEAVIPVTFGHLTASNITEGHRFMAPAAIPLNHAKNYVAALHQSNVMVDAEARKKTIHDALLKMAKDHRLTLREDDGLLEEVTGLVEWPVVHLGEFDKGFLSLPPEVLISEMKHHQRYFALSGADGKLTNSFLIVANRPTSDGGKAVIAGNSRVLRARLSDGAFYWEQDQKKPLTDWAKGLADMVFHAKVGRMDKEVDRTKALAIAIAKEVGYTNLRQEVERAAELCKADLTTGMVGEFPDLQGIMGRYYALQQNEPEAVAEAIYEHYKPVGANDSLPTSELGAILSVADKLRMMQSLFAAGEKPTGSKDPFALRRAALGALRIVIDRKWYLDFASFTPSSELLDFLRERLKNLLRDEGIRHDIIEASFVPQESDFKPFVIRQRAQQFSTWLATESGKNCLAAINRALNIVAAEEKKSKSPIINDSMKNASLAKPEEKKLWAVMQQMPHTTIVNLEQLTTPINAFFEASLVTEEGFREARLSLLAGVRDAAMTIADFTKIEG
jgi:glycyl-tRNA synthetase beta chain